MLGVMLFILGAWVSAQIAIPLPPYWIPATLQTLAVFCAALCLGPVFGSVSMGGYLLLGMIGLPVFADSSGGYDVVFGHTGGYLLAFLLCPPVMCWIIRRRNGEVRGWLAMGLSVLVANAIVFLIGVPWLKLSLGLTWFDAWWHGCVVFWPLTALKIAAAVWIGRIAAPWAAQRIW